MPLELPPSRFRAKSSPIEAATAAASSKVAERTETKYIRVPDQPRKVRVA